MLLLAGLLSSFALTTQTPLPARLPFTAPRTTQVTEALRCDTATVAGIDGAKGILRGSTPAGAVVYLVATDVPMVKKDGTAVGGLAGLAVGQIVRIYYTTGNGARVQEIDLD